MGESRAEIQFHRDETSLDQVIEELLEDPSYAGQPLREALADLFSRYRQHLHQLEKITRIADRYQNAERERGKSYAMRYQRQLRKLEKIIRISDRYQYMLRDVNRRLHYLSMRDELTDLPNRRCMMERLNTEISQAKRLMQELTVALVDIDHFKQINDRYGHVVGDEVLVWVASTLKGMLREYDVCGRWGGEEFLILLPQTDQAAAQPIVERLCRTISSCTIPLSEENARCQVTVSVGLTQWRMGEPVDHVLKRADDALYKAKHRGRNRYVNA
ncbi:biofilm regulation diguanylate cyclase SiaD [Methylohalobius crimeensis]|uniref:biofilm regulation diguanylate cyclase SiaD n=1 Tax=Methylohalobius crimeensis TaxID=244365 RepID=UPI0003B63DB1|nr:biofilm regulation diguanylate cyclase SiaD [Methylohalobius crimeensis]